MQKRAKMFLFIPKRGCHIGDKLGDILKNVFIPLVIAPLRTQSDDFESLQTLLLHIATSRQGLLGAKGFFPALFLSMKSPERKIITFSVGTSRAVARAPRVTRCMHIFDRPSAQTSRSRPPPLSPDPIADILTFAGLIIFRDQGPDSNANQHSKRQDFGFSSVSHIRPSLEKDNTVMDAFQETSAESSTPGSVQMTVGGRFASKSQHM